MRRTRPWATATVYLHGLAEGDFELEMRGLLGEGAPLSKAVKPPGRLHTPDDAAQKLSPGVMNRSMPRSI